MPGRPLRLLLALSLVTACDGRSDEELGSMIAAKVDPIASAQRALSERVAQAEVHIERVDGLVGQVAKLETQVAELSAQAVALETQLADAQSRIDELKKEVDKPTAAVAAGRPDPAAYYKVEIGDAQAIGSASALVTIVTWSDFQCPYCNRVTSTIDQLRRDYGKNLRYVFKHNPLAFHKEARSAALAAEAAGEQGKFWEMHDLLFENSRDLGKGNYVGWARRLGLDVKRFERDMESPALAARVDAQQAEGNRLGARGTPAFFVNGRFLSGAQPVGSFKVLIDEEMKKAEAKVAAGTPASRVYAETIATGRTAP